MVYCVDCKTVTANATPNIYDNAVRKIDMKCICKHYTCDPCGRHKIEIVRDRTEEEKIEIRASQDAKALALSTK